MKTTSYREGEGKAPDIQSVEIKLGTSVNEEVGGPNGGPGADNRDLLLKGGVPYMCS